MAADFAERYLRRLPASNRVERASGLELLVRAELLLGRRREAAATLQELASIAEEVGTSPLAGSARYAAGLAAAGDDPESARRHFEDAVDLFQQSGAPFETARARIELARSLAALGRVDEARAEADRAVSLLSAMHADTEIARARAAVPGTAAETFSGAAPPDSPLSRREIEVLRHVAQGLSNLEVGERLFISEHTVHRHVANILTKLEVSSRAAAVARGLRDKLI